ncbi:hypothetical protein M8J77_024175 [Diaphorina citri]|nr:hypothetical protein M8J77_024175 [Diaphorina citri]
MWIIIRILNVKPEIILAALYLNPSYNMKICMEELDDTLNKIEHENPGSSIILFGDLNARTGSPQDVEEEDLLTFENSTLLPREHLWTA